ncbi:retrovirus-related Pol polyprotein from transposon opus [Trichonephila clavata]|uniref:Retrovirus-related Pol polyprotein from transposon opus n=1 Tax=Trichonephila clavata TaxID=2740835 RepID=A0A8X6G4Y0_TRICU|nr:retrovirus-related Pol polyprotein from transposon opus [Trichonephila clavata]
MLTLYTPVLNRPFQPYTDALATIVGACLAQNDKNGMEHPISFYSKKVTKCRTNWSTIEKAAYAVLSALKKFDCWIFGSQIQVVSDHNPLSFLTKGLPHGAKLARWALHVMSCVLYTVRGKTMTLSRLPFAD